MADLNKNENKTSVKKISLIFLLVYVVLCVGAIIADKIITGEIKNSLHVIFLLPCIWALVLRPIFIIKPYFGNYVLIDVISLCVFMFWYSFNHSFEGSVGSVICFGIPVLCLISVLLLVLGFFIYKDMRSNAKPYLLVFCLASATSSVASLIMSLPLWLPVTAFSISVAVILWLVLALKDIPSDKEDKEN